MEKVISIIIPTYNMEKYLRKCLDSLVVSDENMKQLEVLVVNDGSKDSSSLIAHEYEKRFPETFRVIDKENGNYGSCINRGLKEISGKYVKILDADDYFNVEAFDEFITLLKGVDADLVLSFYNNVSENGDITKCYAFKIPYNTIIQRCEIDGMEEFCGVQMHAITYRTKIFSEGKYKQSEGISYTDQEWIFTPMYNVKTVFVTNLVVYQYLLGREGQTMDPKVLVKNSNNTIISTLKMVSDFNTMSFSSEEDDNRFFKYKLTTRLRYIYQFFLLKYRSKLSIDDLSEFDRKLRNLNQEVYNWPEKIKLLSCHYVKRWRKKPNDFMVFFLGRICQFLTK